MVTKLKNTDYKCIQRYNISKIIHIISDRYTLTVYYCRYSCPITTIYCCLLVIVIFNCYIFTCISEENRIRNKR